MEKLTCADIIKEFLHQNNMSARDFAKYAGRSEGAVSLWLSNRRFPNSTSRKMLYDKSNGELNLL